MKVRSAPSSARDPAEDPPQPARRRQLQASLLSLIAAGLPRAAAQEGVSDGEIRIGQSAQLTGPLAPLSEELRHGASWYFTEVNAKGGIHGRRIRVITLDDGYVATRTVENVKRLIDDERVLALFNLAGTPTTLAALPLVEERNVPLVAPFTGTDTLRTTLRSQVFNVRASYADEIRRITEHLGTIGVTRVAVAYLDNAFGKEALAAAQLAAPKQGVTVTASAPLSVDGKGMAQAVDMIARSGPAAVIVAAAGKGTSDFIDAYQKARAGTQFYALSVVSSQQLLRELGERSRGVVIAQVMPHPFRGNNAAARELEALANRHGTTTLTYNHMEGYLSAKVLVEGLRRAGKALDRVALVRGLESMKDVDLGGYAVRFSDRNHNGSTYVELSVVGLSGRMLK
jgi:branched-chain amino acid transport system substrate-binding protein